jgi:sulfate adenylyltransferase
MANENREQGVAVSTGTALLITGLPAAGKTTLGMALATHIGARFGRTVSLLDGDEVRKLLSSDLGFSREHRRLNVLRHGYVAAEATRHGGIAICTLIAPYTADRAEMRQQVTRYGSFVEVYLSTPLTECERRDPKGLYRKARTGALQHMTGIDDPYEPPTNPELKLDGAKLGVEQLVERVTTYLVERGLLRRKEVGRDSPPTATPSDE